MKKRIIPIIIVTLAVISCTKETVESSIKKDSVTGFVQKGPFNNGTSITINELNTDLSQTGKSYNTQIVDNQGSFEIENIELISNYVSLRADGFYYNEILGEQSSSQITLYAISDISDKVNINVNVLSHLEKYRVEYLVSQGQSFTDAKNQAQKDILDIFNFELDSIQTSESLDISKTGENNGILLAASIILHGYRGEGEFTELLSNISVDLKEDGLLNDSTLGSQLINHASYIDTSAIKANLENRYSKLGIDVNIPNFGKYIYKFLDSTDYQVTEFLIDYPESGSIGQNILDLNRTHYTGEYFSLCANTKENTSLKIRISEIDGDFDYARSDVINWSVSSYENVSPIEFMVVNPGIRSDAYTKLTSGEYLVEYFEMGAITPSKSKVITK